MPKMTGWSPTLTSANSSQRTSTPSQQSCRGGSKCRKGFQFLPLGKISPTFLRGEISSSIDRLVQLNFTPEIKYFIYCLSEIFPVLVWHLSNSIWNTTYMKEGMIWICYYCRAQMYVCYAGDGGKWGGWRREESEDLLGKEAEAAPQRQIRRQGEFLIHSYIHCTFVNKSTKMS